MAPPTTSFLSVPSLSAAQLSAQLTASLPLLALLAAAHVLLLWALKNKRPSSVPGPFELPIIGGLFFLFRFRGRILDGLLEHSREQGPGRTWSIKWLSEKRYFMVSRPDILEHVLKTRFEAYPKGAHFNAHLRSLIGGGIFAVDGPQWRRQRQLFAHVFSMRSFREVIARALAEHGAKLDALLDAAASSGAAVDISALVHRFTLDSIARIAFGTDTGCLSAPAGQEIPFQRAFDEAQQHIDRRFFTPGWQVARRVPLLMPGERALERCLVELDAFCLGLIRERRATGDWKARQDVLSRAMGMVDEATGAAVYPDTDAANRELRDLVISFLIAGRDTTAQALSWSAMLIARHPEVEERISAEARACVDVGADFAPSHEAITSLRYVRAAFCETLRLYPSVPKDLKEAAEDDTLPDGTFVPRGSLIAYLPFVMGRDETLWKDAHTFDPERFYSETGEGTLAGPWKWPVFNGAGPRQCLGKELALVEATFVLGLIYRRYSLTPTPGQERLSHRDSLTLPQARGLTVHVRRR